MEIYKKEQERVESCDPPAEDRPKGAKLNSIHRVAKCVPFSLMWTRLNIPI